MLLLLSLALDGFMFNDCVGDCRVCCLVAEGSFPFFVEVDYFVEDVNTFPCL